MIHVMHWRPPNIDVTNHLISDVKDRATKSNSGISWTRKRTTVLGKLYHDESGFLESSH